MSNQIKEFQGYVLESAYTSGRTDFQNYVEQSIKIFEESNLNIHQIFLLMGHIQSKRKLAETFLDDLHLMNVDTTIEEGLITEEGKLTEHCKNVLIREGYGNLLNPLGEEE